MDVQTLEERRRLRVLTIVTLGMLVMGPFFIYQYIALGIPAVSAAVAAAMVAGALNVGWAWRRRGSRLGGWLAPAILLRLLVFSNTFSGGFYDPNFSWLYVFPILAALLVDARAGWILTGLVLLLAVLFWLAPSQGLVIPDRIPAEMHAEQSLANRISAILAIGVLLGAIASQERFGRRMLERSNEALQQEVAQHAKMQERLVQTDRAASIGNLAGGLAHEINNPLTYVIGNLELIQEDLTAQTAEWPPDERRELQSQIDEALEGALRVAQLIRDLRTFSHPEGDEDESVQLAPVIAQSRRLATGELKHRGPLRVDCEDDLYVVGNEDRLRQALLNLLRNAGQALAANQGRAQSIEVSARRTGDQVLLAVSDTGPGIVPELLDHIFEPFFTTRSAGQGAGMGLFVARNLVESMGGNVTVQSTRGAGSVFTIALRPAAPPAPE